MRLESDDDPSVVETLLAHSTLLSIGGKVSFSLSRRICSLLNLMSGDDLQQKGHALGISGSVRVDGIQKSHHHRI